MYQVPENYLRFADGAKINRTETELRLVKPDGTSGPVQKVSVYANEAVAYDEDDNILYGGELG